MNIAIPKEILNNEQRIALLPQHVKTLTDAGHQVNVEKSAGLGSGFSAQNFIDANARIYANKDQLFQDNQLIIKVKEPQLNECQYLNAQHILFSFLHLAAAKKITQALLDSHCTALAYETLTDTQGRLPLLQPMSAIAGRLSVQAGAHHLQSSTGGKGVLLSGAPGVARAKVLIIGSGTVGINACDVAVGMGADVTVFDIDTEKLRLLQERFGCAINTIFNHALAINRYLSRADLIIGAALIPGAKAPILINEEQLALIPDKTVLVDVAIDQGGVFAHSRPTTYEKPIYHYKNLIFYCVSNMPAAVARTASEALANSSLPFIHRLANGGKKAINTEPFKQALNIERGIIKHPLVQQAFAET